MRVADFPCNTGAAPAKSLQEENKRLHPSLNILGYSWLGKAEGIKDYSSLIVEVDSASTANNMINEGVVHRYDLKTAELFDRNCRIIQCFRCQKYGHISISCQEAQKCGHCGEGHVTEECATGANTASRRCAACNGGNHAAWSPQCSARKKEAERAEKARANRPRLYPITAQKTQSPFVNDHHGTQTSTMRIFGPSQVEPTRTESDSDNPAWEIVGDGKKRKRKTLTKGRPIGSTNKSKTYERTTEQSIPSLFGSQASQTRTSSVAQVQASQARTSSGQSQTQSQSNQEWKINIPQTQVNQMRTESAEQAPNQRDMKL